MRLLLSAGIWIVLVGGLALYMGRRPEPPEIAAAADERAAGSFTLEVTPSFAVEPDPFALQVDDKQAPAALVVRVNGREALRRADRVEPGKPVSVKAVEGLIVGANEFYVEANPPLADAGRAHAVRVRVQRDGRSLAEHTLWSEPGVRLAATFTLQLKAGPTDKDKDAEHDP